MQETQVQPRGREDPTMKEMVAHSSVLVWKILWTEEPGGLLSGVANSWTRLGNSTTTAKSKDTGADLF